jgi:N-acetylmuramate 1-kinase
MIHHYFREEGWSLIEDAGDLNLQQAVFSLSRGHVRSHARPSSSEKARGHGSRRHVTSEDLVATLSAAAPSGAILELYGPVLDLLLDLQLRARDGFRDEWCYQGVLYDEELMVERESGYFLRAFLKGYLGWEVDEGPLMKEFTDLARLASEAPHCFVLHRDFQSRNILLPSQESPCVIDFQGARWGPLQYDVASLVLDPYVPIDPATRRQLLQAYLDRLDARGAMAPQTFMAHFAVIALHRSLQILGAFAFLGSVKGKTFFLQWIPRALDQLHDLMLAQREWDCPILRKWVEEAWEVINKEGLRAKD